MKAKVLLGSLLWLLAITGLHLHLNVGWAEIAAAARRLVSGERAELKVGFLPVT